ncbi:MAG: DUF1636 domain-containing protein [Pseudomonadota bacterium]
MAHDPNAQRDETQHTLFICSKCRGASVAAELRQALEPTLPDCFSIRAVSCMAGCDHPVAVGIQSQAKATYLFGGIETAAEIAAIGAFAHQYAGSTTGWTSASERPAPLTNKTLAHLPAMIHAAGKQDAPA